MWLYPIVKKFVKKGDKLYPLGEEITKKGDSAYKVKNDYAKVESFPPADYFAWEDTTITGYSEKGQAVCDELLGVVFPTSCTEIKEQAFVNGKGFSKFNRIIVTENIKNIGLASFNGVTTLNRFYITEQGEDLILGDAVFGGSGIESFNISKRITELGNVLFSGCGNLKTITSSEREKDLTIKGVVCAGCSNLETAELKGVKNIGTSPIFVYCSNLKKIKIGLQNNAITGQKIADSCGNIEEIEINGNITESTKYLFNAVQSNKGYNVTINGDVETVTNGLFSGCSAKTIKINGYINKIETLSFNDNTFLEEFRIPTTVTSVGVRAFASCKNAIIYVPKTATIEQEAFMEVKQVIYY